MEYIEIHPNVWILVTAVEALEARYPNVSQTGPPDGTIVTLQSGVRLSSDLPVATLVSSIIQKTGNRYTTLAQLLGYNQ